jgi:quinol monooxygenase YgiN
MAPSRDLLIGLAAGAAAGALAVWAALRAARGGAATAASAGAAGAAGAAAASGVPPGHRAYVLAVRITLNPAMGGLAAFLRVFTPLAEYCAAHEGRTLSYQLCAGEEDPNAILIHERYVAKEDLTEVHHKSAAFKALGEALSPTGALAGLVVSKERATYVETAAGYMSR